MSPAFEGFESAVCSAVPLATVTSFHIGGPADHFVEPGSFEEFAALAGRCVRFGIPFRILGKGSNILVSDRGVAGAVFRLTKMKDIARSGNQIICEAGAALPRVVRKAEEWGLSGLEPLAGIPGTIGGAVAMNAGGKYGAVRSVLGSATTLDQLGRFRERTAAELGLDYRRSQLRGEVVLRVVFNLTVKEPIEIAQRRVAILEEKAQTQPLAAWSAGCIFKNPEGQSAGQLIEQAGFKGARVGQAVVSPKHANFIINEGGCTSADVKALIGKVQAGVSKASGVDLDLEIEVWN